MNRSIPLVFYALIGVSCIGITGCDSKSSVSTTNAPAPDVDKAKRFVATLKAMAPEKRLAYITQHQDEVQNVNRSGDAASVGELMQIMKSSPSK